VSLAEFVKGLSLSLKCSHRCQCYSYRHPWHLEVCQLLHLDDWAKSPEGPKEVRAACYSPRVLRWDLIRDYLYILMVHWSDVGHVVRPTSNPIYIKRIKVRQIEKI